MDPTHEAHQCEQRRQERQPGGGVIGDPVDLRPDFIVAEDGIRSHANCHRWCPVANSDRHSGHRTNQTDRHRTDDWEIE